MKPGNLIFRDVPFYLRKLNKITINLSTSKITCDISILIKKRNINIQPIPVVV
jgi:hypothetical protein